jgi:hypothetical protein
VDMRKRFRGNAPIHPGSEADVGDALGRQGRRGGGGGGGGQLYGGRTAFDVREQLGKAAKGEVEGLGFDESKTRGL